MNSSTQKTLKAEIGRIAAPEWWTLAPVGERRFLGGLARMMRSARRSKSPEVARAAVKWERALGCFIKVRLITEKQKAEMGTELSVVRGARAVVCGPWPVVPSSFSPIRRA